MKKTNIGFPYPVLSIDNNDYVESSFSIEGMMEPEVDNGTIRIPLKYYLNSAGLTDMITSQKAQVLIYCESSNSSFRKIERYDFDKDEKVLEIATSELSQVLKLKGMIVSTGTFDDFCFEEHNKELFGNFKFKINKGDILAISNLFEIELDSVDPLANNPSVFSIRPDDKATEAIRVDYQDVKIDIFLRREIYDQYQELRDEPALRTVLASYFVLPALVEVLCFMKDGVSEDDEDIKLRAWYVSITNRLKALKIDLQEQVSMATVANKILTDIVQETMNGLKHIKENVLTGGNSEG